MNFELKSYHFYISLVVFSFLTFLGIIHDIGWSAIFMRSILWTIVISILSVFTDNVVRWLLFPPSDEEELIIDEQTEGQLLNVVLPEEDTLFEEMRLGEALQSDDADQGSLGVDEDDEIQPSTPSAEFKAFAPKQIDTEVERIILNDPAKAAEIIRKMGLE